MMTSRRSVVNETKRELVHPVVQVQIGIRPHIQGPVYSQESATTKMPGSVQAENYITPKSTFATVALLLSMQ